MTVKNSNRCFSGEMPKARKAGSVHSVYKADTFWDLSPQDIEFYDNKIIVRRKTVRVTASIDILANIFDLLYNILLF
jgi:hypothetical protein